MIFIDLAAAVRKLQAEEENDKVNAILKNELSAVAAIGYITRLHQESFGLDRISPCFIHPTIVALNRMTPELPTKDSTDPGRYSDLVTDLCVFARALGRRVPLCVSILRKYQSDVQRAGRKLPTATQDLFVDFEANESSTVNPLSASPFASTVGYRIDNTRRTRAQEEADNG